LYCYSYIYLRIKSVPIPKVFKSIRTAVKMNKTFISVENGAGNGISENTQYIKPRITILTISEIIIFLFNY